MKKVGIITFIKTDNYGAELQGYALQHVLNQYGYDAEDINIDMIPVDPSVFKQKAKEAIIGRLRNNPIKGIVEITRLAYIILKGKYTKPSEESIRKKKDRNAAFAEFWENAIKHSKLYTPETLFDSDINYDYIVAGSDQIWNYKCTSRLDVYFMDWAPKKAKCISYAASISVRSIPEELKPEYKRLLSNVECVSVRENDGVRILQELTDREIEVVLDPTLLLNKKQWMEVASDKYKFDFPYIITYSLNSSKGYWDIVYAYAKKYGYKIINLRHDFNSDNKDPNRIDIFDAGPREFIYLWANASMAITNSFHGTIFSLNFNIPFISILNKVSKTNSRIQSMLTNIGLTDRMVYDTDKIEIKNNSIDFTHANNYLEVNRKKSMEYLLNSLDYNA